MHSHLLWISTSKDEVLRMIDLIEGCGLCGIAQRMRGMCSVQVAVLVSNPEHQFYILCMPHHVTYNTMY